MQNSVYKYLNDIMVYFRIPLSGVYQYQKAHEDETGSLLDIFNLENPEQVQQCFSLLHLLSMGKSNGVIEMFKDEEGLEDQLDMETFNRYKLLLMTALVYNQKFLTISCNIRGMLWQKAAKKAKQQKQEEENGKKGRNILSFKNRNIIIHPIEVGNYAASGVDAGFVQFDNKPIQLENGILKILGDSRNRIYFRFIFKDYPEGGVPPYKVRVFYVTRIEIDAMEKDAFEKVKDVIANDHDGLLYYIADNHPGILHDALLDIIGGNPRHKELILKSEIIENIDYSKGIIILGAEHE